MFYFVGKKHVFQQRCVYLCDWVYVYIHMDIYINADDDDDILGHFLFWSAVFLLCRFKRGNNTFDGKIIVTWLKIARLCGYTAHRVITFMTRRASCRNGVHEWEDIFFLEKMEKKKKRKKVSKCRYFFFGSVSMCFWSCFISSKRKQMNL